MVSPLGEVDWRQWVAATATRAYCKQDPLIDWLDLYGAGRGYLPDEAQPGYSPGTDFRRFILNQGRRFESAVLQHLASLAPITVIASTPGDVRSVAKYQETVAAMRRGDAIIAQAVLWNPSRRTYGAADLLVRSDLLARLFPDALSELEARVPAPALETHFHYRVIDIKFTTLRLLKGGHVSGTQAHYLAQVWIYNEALGLIQGYEPPSGYLLGRGWSFSDQRGRNCTERLGRVDRNVELRSGGVLLEDLVGDAVAWVRRVRTEGITWDLHPNPSVAELYPNMTHQEDQPWHLAKRQIAQELEELTLLWYVGVPGRQQAHRAGFRRWTDPGLAAAVLGVTGVSRAPTLDRIIEINRAASGPLVWPARIRTEEAVWRDPGSLELYVDFETVSNLADDFSRIPDEGGQPLIFMIGCGHFEDGEWRFAQFITSRLDESSEEVIIDAWLAHMASITKRLIEVGQPWVLHWSPAEPINYEVDYLSAKARHPEKSWPDLRWFDLLNRVVRKEPVVVKGALAFGLKAVARALLAHGLIQTAWTDGPTDGLGAMVGAWSCDEEAASSGRRLQDLPLMQEIGRYNEVDCKVMAEIVNYFRESH